MAIIGQSGGIAMAIKRTLEERGVDTGSAITSGNETGLTTADYIAYFASQPEVKVIVSYLESVRDADAFLSAAREARAAGKPVVVVKLGASDADAAPLRWRIPARSPARWRRSMRLPGAAGVMRVRNLDAVVEAVEYLVHAPLPRGSRARRHHLLRRLARASARCGRGAWAEVLDAFASNDPAFGIAGRSGPSSAIRWMRVLPR